jgi:hypothetical protein
MKELLLQQLEELVEKFLPLIKNFEIPESHLETFKKFKQDYHDDYEGFFNKIDKLEVEIFPAFSKIIKTNTNKEDLQFIDSSDIDNFLSGDIIVKTLFNKTEIASLRNSISRLLNSSYEANHRKLLHLLIPDIIKTLFASDSILKTAINFLDYDGADIAFELAFFSIKPGQINIHWHDDYSLFSNKVPDISNNINNRLLLNFHIALTEVTNQSSPLSFIKGTESIIYARPAIKYFKDNGIKFDENLFLKATFLTEYLYKPGQEVKPNFLGLLPSISYRLHQIKNLNQDLTIFFKELDAGMVQIFSPHLWHTSPFLNRNDIARESLVLRFFTSSDYHSTNLITIRELINHLSFAKERDVSLDEIKIFLFKQNSTLSLDSKLYTNIYINKNYKSAESKYLKIYIQDLYNFFVND